MRDWRRWRRTTLAWHEVAEARGQLYRPRGDGRYDKGRYEAALESRATAPSPRAMALHGCVARPAVTRRSSRRPGMCGGATVSSPNASTTSSWGATTTSTTTCRSAPRARALGGAMCGATKMSILLT